jgi:hypothetical protein
MFVRNLDKGECPKHGNMCRSAHLVECDYCGKEFVAHGRTFIREYCSPPCSRRGGEEKMRLADEARRRMIRMNFIK